MAFTNPILAGEELNRTGIRSDNYVAGVSGWRIASNGAAEFDNVGLRGNLWAPTITLAGRDLGAQLNAMPKGILAWVNGYPTTSTTSEAQILFTEVDIVNGRYYEATMFNTTPDIANTKACEYRMRATFDTSSYPDNGSFLFGISLRLSQFELGTVRCAFLANYTGRLRLSARIGSLDGATVRNWAPGAGATLQVVDLGIGPAMAGTVGPGATTKTLKEIYCNSDFLMSYKGNHQAEISDAYLYDKTVQGDFLDGNGFRRTWTTFQSSDRTLIADMVGIPFADVLQCELYINTINWANGAGWPQIGYHNFPNNSLPFNEAGGGVGRRQEYFQNNVGGFWMNLLDDGSATDSIVGSMLSGYFKGFIIGPEVGASGFGDSRYRMVASGLEGGPRPQLHVKYYK